MILQQQSLLTDACPAVAVSVFDRYACFLMMRSRISNFQFSIFNFSYALLLCSNQQSTVMLCCQSVHSQILSPFFKYETVAHGIILEDAAVHTAGIHPSLFGNADIGHGSLLLQPGLQLTWPYSEHAMVVCRHPERTVCGLLDILHIEQFVVHQFVGVAGFICAGLQDKQTDTRRGYQHIAVAPPQQGVDIAIRFFLVAGEQPDTLKPKRRQGKALHAICRTHHDAVVVLCQPRHMVAHQSVVAVVCAELMAVVARQSPLRGNPDASPSVLHQVVHRAAAQVLVAREELLRLSQHRAKTRSCQQ